MPSAAYKIIRNYLHKDTLGDAGLNIRTDKTGALV